MVLKQQGTYHAKYYINVRANAVTWVYSVPPDFKLSSWAVICF